MHLLCETFFYLCELCDLISSSCFLRILAYNGRLHGHHNFF